MKASNTPSHTSPGAEGWKDVLQLLKEQSAKMEKLARALSVIQQGMLRNNPGHAKETVNEASDVFSGMLNTHKCISGRYPKKADKGGEEACSFSP